MTTNKRESQQRTNHRGGKTRWKKDGKRTEPLLLGICVCIFMPTPGWHDCRCVHVCPGEGYKLAACWRVNCGVSLTWQTPLSPGARRVMRGLVKKRRRNLIIPVLYLATGLTGVEGNQSHAVLPVTSVSTKITFLCHRRYPSMVPTSDAHSSPTPEVLWIAARMILFLSLTFPSS